MKTITTIGSATQDIFIKHEEMESVILPHEQGDRSCIILPEGKKIEVTDLHYATGGGATNTGVSFKRLGFAVNCVVKLCEDDAGTMVLDALAHEGINTGFVIRSCEQRTGTSFIIPSPKGNDVILAYRGVNATLRFKEINPDLFAQTDNLYITSLSDQAAACLLPIVKIAKQNNTFIATNPGSSQLKKGIKSLHQALPYIDILILNTHEAQRFMASLIQEIKEPFAHYHQQESNQSLPELLRADQSAEGICFNIREYCKLILKKGPQIVVVTNGAEGVYVAHDSKLYFQPTTKATIKSTVGAGDAFGSCFVASIIEERSIKEALARGITNAHHVIQKLDAKEGLLTAQELDAAATHPSSKVFDL